METIILSKAQQHGILSLILFMGMLIALVFAGTITAEGGKPPSETEKNTDSHKSKPPLKPERRKYRNLLRKIEVKKDLMT